MKPKKLTNLAREGKVSSKPTGQRGPESLWSIEVLNQAKREAKRILGMGDAYAIAVMHAGKLALYPDKHAVIEGMVADLNFKRLEDEIFYRLVIEDKAFRNTPLRVFFWPESETQTIWIVGVMQRKTGYPTHWMEVLRKRVNVLVASGVKRMGRK